MRWMCWTKDVWCDCLEEMFVEYYCKAADYLVRKPKSQHAPPCFRLCEKAKKEEK